MNARQFALTVLNKSDDKKTYANLELKKFLDIVDQKDRALATELVYGVIRYKSNLDYIRAQFSNLKENKISGCVKNILRIGIYQIMYLDKIPDSAACNESVRLTYKYANKGAVGFVNAVLRKVCKNKNITYPVDRKEYLMTKYSFPSEITDIILRDFPETAENIFKELNINKPKSVRPNLLKITIDEFEKFLNGDYKKDGNCYYTDSLSVNSEEFKKGFFTFQGRASMMSVELLMPESGEKVLDLCAAPGGKSAYICEKMNNKGEIVSCDIHDHRVELIENTAKRLGCDIIKPVVNDGTVFNKEFDGMFDRVLVDAPCSGLGVISKKPDIKWNCENFDSLINLQYNILNNAIGYLKNGGTLVYSTCTLNNDENRAVVEKVLRENNNISADSEYITLLPCNEYDGFFMCRLKKEEVGASSDKL